MSAMIRPCIWLDDQAEQAAEYYLGTIPGGRVLRTTRYPAGQDNPSGKEPGSVLTVDVELAGQPFSLLNGGPQFHPNQTVSFFLELPEAGDVDRVAAALAEGGTVMMELGSYPWSARYAWIADRYGVSWQVMLIPGVTPGIATCLMFNGEVAGRAEEALEQYASVFGGSIRMREHYAPEAGPTDMLVHGRASFGAGPDAVELVCMDSPMDHGVAFSEGLSLQFMAPDQEVVDRCWELMTEGGAPSVCGWLTDRFGFSWQVTPTAIEQFWGSPDEAAAARAFAAMMTMTKPDIAALEAAFARSDGS